MGCIVWKPIRGRYYAYLDTSYYDPAVKGPRYKGVYLGATLERAEEKLRELIQCPEELSRLLNDLHRKRPEGRPPGDEAEKVLKAMDRLSSKTKDARARNIILEAIEKLKEVGKNGKENRKE